MKAIVYQGPGKKEMIEVPMPKIIDENDAVVKVTKTTICGTDLHILKGDVPTMKPGRILGHEAIGIVEEVGSAVKDFKKGDKVIMSCVSACGTCKFCKMGLPSHCEKTGGWILGNLIDGVQAEYVRTPYADTSLYKIPDTLTDDEAVLICDILPTGLEIGVQRGNVQPGKTVAIVGAGPIGMSALIAAQLYSPSKLIMVDLDEKRLARAKEFGATHLVNPKDPEKAIKEIYDLTDGLGVDVAIEAVGIEPTFDICQKIVAAGGNIANVGVHGKPVTLHIEDLWIRNINLSTGLVNTNTIPMLMKIIEAKKIPVGKLITHHFKFEDSMEAYEVFSNPSKTNALKVVLEFD